ncbi:hypothetical protein C5746_21680 [Streptomyces atratus]|uniref:Uncharacterized protein n=1 Tax=Streptomyces atratus TaxID=1893 RepID=A0A2Z5JFH6_STRAR|nr:hypothetical protein C5746_21680 [Streptomyces atratus]
MPAQRSRRVTWITAVERAAAALGCSPWKVGPCIRYSQPTRRYGHDAAVSCGSCRSEAGPRPA